MRRQRSVGAEPPPAVILAAGNGARLGAKMSKPLAPLLGQSLIERSLRSCVTVGVRQFVVVVGQLEEQVRAHLGVLAKRLGVSIACVRAERWYLGNGASTLAAANQIGNRPFFLLMADHLLDPEILSHLLVDPPASGEVCLAVDHGGQPVFDLEDATKVRCLNGRLEGIGKDLDEWDGIDTGAFLCTPAIFEALEKAQDAGRYCLSHGIAELASDGLVRAVDVTGYRWLDVDTPEALAEAERRLLASLDKGGQDGFISRWINRPLSTRLSKYLVRTAVTPNQITVSSFLIALAASALLALGAYPAGVVAGVLIMVASVIDGCDGEVARLKAMVTPRGAWLDTMLDRYADLAITVAIVTAYAKHFPGALPWLAGMVAVSGFILVSYVTKEFTLRHESAYPNDILDRVKHRDLRLLVLSVGAVTGFPFQALVLAGVFSHALVVSIMLRGWRRSLALTSAPG
jgi:CDP-L-myo-inositol myo-inositolphosphotransferase